MSENKHTAYDLAQMQSLPLEAKIRMSQRRIREWYDHWDGEVYVSFSGGKDSTVLLHLVREMYPEVPAVFVDTGLEYPEIKQFVRTFENVTILRPQMSFKQVIEKYGYPVVSKKTARYIRDIRKNIQGHNNTNVTNLRLTGYTSTGRYAPSQKLPDKWRFLIDAPFDISEQCCDAMKKRPMYSYAKTAKRHPMTAVLASESDMRRKSWEQFGCNLFNAKHPVSNPLSFWTEQDILTYILQNKLAIAEVYGEIVIEETGGLGTTGVNRTGCVFCMFGAHLEPHPNRFERLKITHPQLWDYCMKPRSGGGSGCVRYVNSAGSVPVTTMKHLKAVPLELSQANAFVASFHRHHEPVHRDKFRIGCSLDGKLVGVVQIARPVSRYLGDGKTVEVVRLCTDGTKDVCSFLYAKAARIAKEMGYSRIITYILDDEPGTSLTAAGWRQDSITSGGNWSRPSRPRNTTAPTVPKKRYVKILQEDADDIHFRL